MKYRKESTIPPTNVRQCGGCVSALCITPYDCQVVQEQDLVLASVSMDKLNQWTGAADMVGQVVNLRTDYRMESEWICNIGFR